MKKSITPTASGYSFIAKAPSVATLIRKFSSKICPFLMFLREVIITSPPRTIYATTRSARAIGEKFSAPKTWL